jgi:electron transfer flavoprotein alpha subunit
MANAILVLAEQLRGELADITFEMLGAGRKLASASGAPLYAVLLGSEAAPLAAKLGLADKVFVADDPQFNLAPANTIATALKALMDQTQAGLVLLGCTNVSLGIGAILSAKAGLSLVNFCRAAKVEGGAVVCTSQLFGGKILSDVKLADGRGVVSLYPGAFPVEAGKSDQTPPVEKVDLPVEASKVTYKLYL